MHPSKIMGEIRVLAAMYRPTWSGISAAIERSGVPTMHVAEGSLRDTLKEVEGQLAEKRAERAGLLKAREEVKDQFASADDKSPDGDAFKAAEEKVKALGECDDSIDALRQTQEMTLRLLGKDPETAPAGDPSDPRIEGWDSSRMFAADGLRERLTHAATSKSKMGGLDLGQTITRDALARSFGLPMAADVEPTDIMRRGAMRPIVPQLRRPLTVLDLVPTGTMDNNTFQFVREEGSLDGAAAGVKEGATKAQGGFEFIDDEAVARTIAEYMKIKKQSLADVSALRSTIDSRLRYSIERALEREVLSGKGTDPELHGILQTTGIGLVKFKSGELLADQTLRAITTILLANARATGVVMNPVDWQEILLAKAKFGTEGGSGNYYGGGPFGITPDMLWGVPLIPSIGCPEGVVLAGDFTIGVQLLIREGINVLMSDSDQDDFIKNRVTMLAECRAANVIWRPPAFCKVYSTKAAEEAKL